MKMKQWMRVSVIVAACAVALTFAAEDKKPEPGDANAAWQEVLKAMRPPPPPAEWRTTEPTKAQIAAWEKKNGELASQAADKAKEFYTKFPSHTNVPAARRRELELIGVAIQLGETNRQAEFAALQEKRLSDPTVPADEKFDLRAKRIVQALTEDESTNRAPLLEKSDLAPNAKEPQPIIEVLARRPAREKTLALLQQSRRPGVQTILRE